MKHLVGLATRVFNTPLAIWPAKGDAILHVLGPHLGILDTPNVPQALLDVEKDDRSALAMTDDGIAVIDISGTLVRKASGLKALSGLASYADVEADFQSAMEDPRCKGVLALFDSPGGEAGGLFDLCDTLAKFSKPVYGSVSEMACSAAYAIAASVCDKIFITQTAAVGSIGVYCMHVDQSEADKKAGLKYEYIKYGAQKAQGNPHEPLSDSARATIQSEIDRTGDMFVAIVAESRGITTRAVKGTEAAVYFAEDAIRLKLADAIGTQEDALAALRSAVIPQPTSRKYNNGFVAASVGGSQSLPIKGEQEMQITVNMTDISGAPGEELSGKIAAAIHEALKPQAAKPADPEPDPEDPDEPDEEEASTTNEECDMKKGAASANPIPPTTETNKEKAAMTTQDVAPVVEQAAAIDVQRINALCKIAGRTDLLSGFIGDGLTVAKVEEELLKLASDESAKHQVSGHFGNPAAKAAANGFTVVSQMLSEARNTAQAQGVTKEQAFVQLLEKNPGMYAQFKKQKQAAIFRHNAGDENATRELFALASQ